MAIIVVAKLKTLNHYLKKTDVKYRFVCFARKDGENVKLLKENLHEEIDIVDYPESFREKFFSSYIDLIGSIGAEVNSIYWWASFTASKNRFISKLLPNLLAYYTVCNKLNENLSKDILLISPPYLIIPALKQYCKQNSIEFRTIDHPFTSYWTKTKESVEHFLRIMYFILTSWFKIFFVKIYFNKYFRRTCSQKQYYVLRTCVYPSSIGKDNAFSDSFFGRLPEFLTARKENVIILAGIANNYRNTAKRLSNCKEKYLIVPQEYYLKYSDVVKTALKVLFNRINLTDRIQFYGFDVSRIIQSELDKDHRIFMRTNLLLRYIIKNMVRHLKVHTFTTTYENNPWEKVCFLSFKEFSPSTKIIGYQHAVVAKASANMFASKKEIKVIPMPDKIITVGEITKKTMEKYGYYPDNSIYASCALRHEYMHKLRKKDSVRNNTILVALEGVYECYRLVNFVFTALYHTKYQVIIKTHPERPFDKIKNDLCFDINLHENFSISSDKTLEYEFAVSDILIYWGSTVSLEALMMGMPVIHVNLDDIISVDPLSECSYLKWTVKDPEKLLAVVDEINSLADDVYSDQYRKAKTYIEEYLQKVTDDRLQEFIV